MRSPTLIACPRPVIAAAQKGHRIPRRGQGFRPAIAGRGMYDPNGWQAFRSSGRTLCNAGADSRAYWQVQGDRYCGQWPFSDLTCYTMARPDERLRFIGEGGDVTESVHAE